MKKSNLGSKSSQKARYPNMRRWILSFASKVASGQVLRVAIRSSIKGIGSPYSNVPPLRRIFCGFCGSRSIRASCPMSLPGSITRNQVKTKSDYPQQHPPHDTPNSGSSQSRTGTLSGDSISSRAWEPPPLQLPCWLASSSLPFELPLVQIPEKSFCL